MPKGYNVKQVAEILGYSTNSIYAFLKEGRLKGIRLGKGRFRIPQEEIDRLLLTTPKNETAVPKTVAGKKSQDLGITPSPEINLEINLQKRLLKIPPLFVWYIGITSVIMGASLFIGTDISYKINAASYQFLFLPLKMALITGGLGLLISDFVGKEMRLWRKVFRWLLFSSYLILAVFLGLAKDLLSFTIFGTLALVLLIRFSGKLGSVVAFRLCFFLLLIFIPPSILFSKAITLPEKILFLTNNPWRFSLIYLSFLLVYGLILKWTQNRSRLIFWLVLLLADLLLIAISWINAQNLYWSKALFLLLTALTAFFVPWWSSFNFSLKRDRLMVFSGFALILSFILTTVLVIHLMQANLVAYAQIQLKDKAVYGQVLVDQILDSEQSSLEVAAAHPLLGSFFQDKEAQHESLMGFLRLVKASNQYFRRLVVMDKTGDVLAYYPRLSVFEGKNFRFRDYFQQVLSSQKTYISGVIVGITNDPIVVIATPIFDDQKNLIGVISGALDLNLLNNQLQKIANSNLGEYFLLLDNTDNYVVHPDSQAIGLNFKEKVNQDTASLIKVSQALNHLNWTIIVQVPASKVLAPGRTTLVTVYLVISLLVCVIVVILLRMYPKIIRKINGF
jgi:excisionase family DNA binding protein